MNESTMAFESTEKTEILGYAKNERSHRIRNLSGFWLLGLCNNYSYVIMLSAAFDILHPKSDSDVTQNSTNSTVQLCNPTSTGAILLADILPALFIKITAPFFFAGLHLRILVVIILAVSSFLLTSFSLSTWVSFLGVICASFSSGLGEVTCLSFSSHYEKNVVSTWSSGTGGAGVIGALSYAAITHVISPRKTLQIMLVIPVIMALVFWILLVHPEETKLRCLKKKRNTNLGGAFQDFSDPPADAGSEVIDESVTLNNDPVQRFTFKEKLSMTKPLLKYMAPLGLVYMAEYFINQGLLELIFFDDIWLNHTEQYRWYQVIYQIGVLISRSSVNLIHIKKLWILPILQTVNAIFLFFVAYYMFLPSIWIVMVIVLYEGLLGGAAYVNTFYNITENVDPTRREFSLGITSLSDSIGIAFAGAIAIPVHDALCKVL